MSLQLEVLFTPAEFRTLHERDLTNTICVVFDIFRATSTMVTALAHGANGIIPVDEIPDALALQRQNPGFLLAGERGGLRIGPALTGGVEFDLGNSPREFTTEKVSGKTIIATTTNGTRALRACARAKRILTGSFLNLSATVDCVLAQAPARVLLVCAGTGENAALEDVLAAGAFCERTGGSRAGHVNDSAEIARAAYEQAKPDLLGAARKSENARRLLSIGELQNDVGFCLQLDQFPLIAAMEANGIVMKSNR